MQKSNSRPPRQREARMLARPGKALSPRTTESTRESPGESGTEKSKRPANETNGVYGTADTPKRNDPGLRLEKAVSSTRVDDLERDETTPCVAT